MAPPEGERLWNVPPSPMSSYTRATHIELPPPQAPNPSDTTLDRTDPNENPLIIHIGGTRGYISPAYLSAIVGVFASSCTPYARASMNLIWERNRWNDPDGSVSFECIRQLFGALAISVDQSPTSYRGRRSIETLQALTISIPDDVRPTKGFPIDLSSLSSLLDFHWRGGYQVLLTVFRGLRFYQLTTLRLTQCSVSDYDAWSILSRCLNLVELEINHLSHLQTPSRIPWSIIVLNNLRRLMIVSSVRLIPFISFLSFPNMTTFHLWEGMLIGPTFQMTPLIVNFQNIQNITMYDGRGISAPRYLILVGGGRFSLNATVSL